MSVHRVFMEGGVPGIGEDVAITGEEGAHAAGSKRLRAGERVELLDGAGAVGVGVVVDVVRGRRAGSGVMVRVASRHEVEPIVPELSVWTAVPKGGRADELVDGLSQVGAGEWCPLETRRGEAGARASKVDRLVRVAREASKQSGRAWTLRLGPARTVADACARAAHTPVVVADASGEAYRAIGVPRLVLLVGPEGGWERDELEALRGAGAVVARFGPHVMRIETAAVVAAGIVLEAERRLLGA